MKKNLLDTLVECLGYELTALKSKFSESGILAYCLVLDDDAATAYLTCYISQSDPIEWDYWTEWGNSLSREERASLPSNLSTIGKDIIDSYDVLSKKSSDDQIKSSNEDLYVNGMKLVRDIFGSEKSLFLVAHFSDLEFIKNTTIDINPPSALRDGFVKFIESMEE